MRQEERRAATRALVLAAAERCFGDAGFEATSVDRIAERAGVAKGAVYHHFISKQVLFEAVFETVSARLCQRLAAGLDPQCGAVATLVHATETFFRLCSDPATARILLHDAPGVLGHKRWRELEERQFGGLVAAGLEMAMGAGEIVRQPVAPLARIFLSAIQAAALDAAVEEDFEAAAAAYLSALASLLNGLRPRT